MWFSERNCDATADKHSSHPDGVTATVTGRLATAGRTSSAGQM